MEQEINIEEIMKEIYKKSEQIRASEPVGFEVVSYAAASVVNQSANRAFNHDQLRENIGLMNASCTVPFYRPLPGSGIKLFIKKVVRKLVFAVLRPIIEDIEHFHACTTRSMNEVGSFVDEQKKADEEKNRQIHELQQEIENLKKELQKGCS